MKIRMLAALLLAALVGSGAGSAEARGKARTVKIKGAPARTLMEALASAGVEIKNLDQEWSSAPPFSLEVKALSCDYNVEFPDEWMSDVECNRGSGKTLKNSLAIAKALQPFVPEMPHTGARTLSVASVSCTFDHAKKGYSCSLVLPSEDTL